MDWQTIAALVIVAVAATALLWGKLRRRKFDFHRDTGCGCSSPSDSKHHESIVFHARKGERPKVIVKNR